MALRTGTQTSCGLIGQKGVGRQRNRQHRYSPRHGEQHSTTLPSCSEQSPCAVSLLQSQAAGDISEHCHRSPVFVKHTSSQPCISGRGHTRTCGPGLLSTRAIQHSPKMSRWPRHSFGLQQGMCGDLKCKLSANSNCVPKTMQY